MRGTVARDRVSTDPPPHGYRWVWKPDPEWRVLPPTLRPPLCRRSGPGHVFCENEAVAEFQRQRSGRGEWWGYCADHLYGRRIEDGVVLHRVARPVREGAA